MWANAQRDGPLPNIGGALSSTPQSLADSQVPCSNAAKTRNPLKFALLPQTPEPISAVSGSKFTILRGHVEEVLLLNKFFFPTVHTCLNCEDTAQQSYAMVPRWRFFASFLCPIFPASRVQHISDLHPKFALKPHHVYKYGRHPLCDR